MKTEIFNRLDLPKIVEQLYNVLPKCQALTFTGPLGAGKTTVIRELLKKAGITDSITSPTFNYVNVYHNDKGQTFYHFDLYRINSLEEFIGAGFDELLFQPHSWAFIEWPEVIEPLLHKGRVCAISLDYGQQEDQRVIKISY